MRCTATARKSQTCPGMHMGLGEGPKEVLGTELGAVEELSTSDLVVRRKRAEVAEE